MNLLLTKTREQTPTKTGVKFTINERIRRNGIATPARKVE
jgi:hypothetical protein